MLDGNSVAQIHRCSCHSAETMLMREQIKHAPPVTLSWNQKHRQKGDELHAKRENFNRYTNYVILIFREIIHSLF